MRVFNLLVLVGWFILVADFSRAALLDDLATGETARVVDVVDGDTVVLDRVIDNARQVRLVGIQAPKLPLGRKGFREWPLAPDAKYALEQLTLGKRVSLRFGGARMDRHGRHLAHLVLDDGTWVQGRLLEAGMARVYTFPDNRAVADDMYRLERNARTAKRGIWSHPFYAIREATPAVLTRLTGTFQIIQGRVLDAAKVKGNTYLNFGANWRDDFTITLNSRARRSFIKKNQDPMDLKNKVIRVRGWLKKRNGPAVSVSHPEQIEIFDNHPEPN